MSFHVKQLTGEDLQLQRELLALFGEAFQDAESYARHPPSDEYLRRLLGSESFIALVALNEDEVVGGLAAYELRKFEQERSEFYIYDLAVGEQHRRRGIATALIRSLGELARARGAYVMMVQADTGDEDRPAIALYSALARPEQVLQFDLPVRVDATPP